MLKPIGETLWDFKEGELSMDPNFSVEKLTVSLQSYEPFSTCEVDSSKGVVAQDIVKTDVIVGALNSVNMVESSGQKDVQVKDKVTCDDSSHWRSSSLCVMKEKTETKRAARKGKKTANKKLALDLIFLNVARRRRSCFRMRTRLSNWGSLGHIGHIFRHNANVDISQSGHTKSLRARSDGGGVTRNNNQTISSQRSKERRHISLKVKLGKKVGQSNPMDIAHITENDCQKSLGNRLESPKLTKNIEDKFEKEIPNNTGVQYCNANMEKTLLLSDTCLLDVVHHAENNITEKVDGKTADFHNGISVDPGTSPDSEVINMIPDGLTSGKIPEVLCDVLITSQDCEAVNWGVGCEFFSPEITDNAGVAKKYGCIDKIGDGLCSGEASISTKTGNASVSISSSDLFTAQPLPSLEVTNFGVSTETLDVVNGLDVQHESSESGVLKKILPCTNKPKGENVSKGSRSTKRMSEAPRSACSKGSSYRQKGNQSKRKVKEKGAVPVQVISKRENYSEKGSHTLDDLGESCTGVTSGLTDQYVPPRNAWVSCDNCNKWRHIPVALADAIEETKSRWICKDNIDKNFADCSIPQEKSNAEINAELEISDASCEEDTGDARLNSRRLGQKQSTVSEQSSWKLIRSNQFLHRSRKTQTIDEIMVCHCKAPQGGGMGCGDGCLNRMLNIECVKGTCPCGDLCSNHQFQKRKYAKLKCFRSGKKGYGLESVEDIREGQFLIEYVGEVLDMHAYEDRQREYAKKGQKHYYFMTLYGSEVIDACAKGNLGRFMNHSCEPNCRTEKWMVNGEVCIGIFALRDIKKGEEVTFDYNYVRVFGAAAKKCVCGSSQCRGYIGGDPSNAEVVVPDDSDEEYLEPVVVCVDGDDNLENNVLPTGSINIVKEIAAEKDYMGPPANAVGKLELIKGMHSPANLSEESNKINNSSTAVESVQRDSSTGSRLESLTEMDSLVTSSPSMQTVQEPETSCLTTTLCKLLPDTPDSKRKSKYDNKDDSHVVSASHPIMKSSRLPSSVKQGKSRKSTVQVSKPGEMDDKSQVVPYKSKKLIQNSSNDPFEAVQVKLNELLDADGGITKQRDATRGYLKLLFLTAASSDSGNGEAIQSNRDLSMILDALLKTKSRAVLVDIISKNGLQMLHNIMKRYRKEFHKIPILRKLLKVLEYLAAREILTLEHITSGPRCAGVESFGESILSLTEHTDKQVHQIARKFRDKWIPRPVRRNNYMDRDFCCTGCVTNNRTRIQKHKTRTEEENLAIGSPLQKESRIQPRFMQKSFLTPQPEICESRPRIDTTTVDDGGQNFDEDAPPGFSLPITGPLISPNVSSSECRCEVVVGHPQERFISRFPVSYGIPCPSVQQFGTLKGDIAVGIPFQPYPPLPPYPRDGRGDGRGLAVKVEDRSKNSAAFQSDQKTPSTYGSNNSICQNNFQRKRSASTCLNTKYFRQQKKNNSNFPSPWIRNKDRSEKYGKQSYTSDEQYSWHRSI